MLRLNPKGIRHAITQEIRPEMEGRDDEGWEASDVHPSHAFCRNTGAIATKNQMLRYPQNGSKRE